MIFVIDMMTMILYSAVTLELQLNYKFTTLNK